MKPADVTYEAKTQGHRDSRRDAHRRCLQEQTEVRIRMQLNMDVQSLVFGSLEDAIWML